MHLGLIAREALALVAREIVDVPSKDGKRTFKIDTEHLNLTTTDPYLIEAQRDYCTIEKGCPLEWATMHYRPVVVGNAIFAGLFAVLMVAHLFFGIRKKTWNYMIAVCLGILLELAGYIGRVMYNKNPFIMRNFLMNLIPLTLAPALLTAGIYVCLARVITAVGAEYSRLRPKWYTFTFVGCDLLSLVLQAIGGALAASADDKDASQRGVNIMIAGLVSQIISMVIFAVLWGDFAFRAKKAKMSGTARAQPPLYEILRNNPTFRWFQWSLVAATFLIFVRCTYRVAELWGGFDSHLANHELTFMIFEGPMIVAAVTIMAIWHPGRVFDDLWAPAGKGVRSLKGDDSSASSSVGLTEWKTNTRYERV